MDSPENNILFSLLCTQILCQCDRNKIQKCDDNWDQERNDRSDQTADCHARPLFAGKSDRRADDTADGENQIPDGNPAS